MAGYLQKKTGYRLICVFERQYVASRLAWWFVYDSWPGERRIDHINHLRDDNRISNLRLADASANAANMPARSKPKGVYKRKNGRFSASIGVNYRHIHLGVFDTEQQAAAAYNEAATRHFGEFACLNT